MASRELKRRLVVPGLVLLALATGEPGAEEPSSEALTSLAESPPVQQTIYYVGKESTTDFDRPGMGLHLRYFPAFGLDRAELALPTDCHDCLEETPDFENFKHQSTADLHGRTFSPDAPGVGVEGDPDFEPDGVRTAGGFSDWAIFTLPGGRTGLSGSTRDPAACGGSNNFVNQLRINSSSLHEFCLNIITDNTRGALDPNLRLEARSDTAGFDLAGVEEFAFDGRTDMYTFRYRGMQEGDRIKIRIAARDDTGTCLGPGVGGIMVSHISTCTPPPGTCVPQCAAARGCEDDGCGHACGECLRADKKVHHEGIVDVTLDGSGGLAYHERGVETPIRLAESFRSILDDLETALREEFEAALVAEVAEHGLAVRNFFLEITPDRVTMRLSPLAAPNEDKLGLEFVLGGVLTHAKYKPTDGLVNSGSLNPAFSVTINAPGIGVAGAYDPATGTITGPWDPATQRFAPDPVGVFDEEGFEVRVDPNSDWQRLEAALDLFDLGGSIGNVLVATFTGDAESPLPSTDDLAQRFDTAIREALDEKLGSAAAPELGGLLRPAVELVPDSVEIGGVDHAPRILAEIRDPAAGGSITLAFDDTPSIGVPEAGAITSEDAGRFSLDVFGSIAIETLVRTTTFPEVRSHVDLIERNEDDALEIEGWVCAESLERSLDIGLFADGHAIEVTRADLESEPAIADACLIDGGYGRFRYALSATNEAMGLANVWDQPLSLIAGYEVFEQDLGEIRRSTVTHWAPDTGADAVVVADGATFIGDFDGDGLADHLAYASGSGWQVARSNGVRFDPPRLWLTDPALDTQGRPTITINDGHTFVDDFDGDGRDDLLWYNGGLYVATSNGASLYTPSRWRVDTGAPRLHNWPYEFTGDFDGDGRADYMVNFGGWQVALSQGQGFGTPTLWLANDALPGVAVHSDGREFLADFTGDDHVDYLWDYLGWHVASTLVTPTQYLSSAVDSDGDGIVDPTDNCPDLPNPGQHDADRDGRGDVCDHVCADGLDNDGDGETDFPYDPGCASETASVEDPACDDGLDNDGDGFTDWPADDDCSPGAWSDREAAPVPEPSTGPALASALLALLAAAGRRMARRRDRA